MKRFSLLIAVLFLAGAAGAEDLELSARDAEGTIALDPFDPVWNNIPATELALMPQLIAPPGGGGATQKIRISVARRKQDLYLRLEWADKGADDDTSRPEGFSDAVAVQFPAQPESLPAPFMGDPENAVAIWRWSASAQKDFDEGYRSNTASRPRMQMDLYLQGDDSTFRAGEKAGNIVSQKRRASPVESLAARGFGTLTPTEDQPVQGKGVWKDGRWHVVLRRGLTGTPPFLSGSRLPFAVAVWDGASRERNGMKSVSVWQSLSMPGTPARAAEDAVAKGRRHFARYGCAVCHGAGGKGGVANPNAQVNPIPALNRVKEAFTKEELLNVVLNGREPAKADPSGPPARFKMNAWSSIMSQAEADAIADYLFSLMPNEKGQEW